MYTMNKILKKILLSLTVVITAGLMSKSYGQDIDLSLMTPTWELIANKTYLPNAKKELKLTFPKELKAMENKMVVLPGYIIPVKPGNEYMLFMLSVVPMQSCPYCGSGDVPSMVEVHMAKKIRFSEMPVKIKGKLVLNESGDNRSEVFLMDAEEL